MTFSDSFFHVLSCSFMFFHFHSCSFFFFFFFFNMFFLVFSCFFFLFFFCFFSVFLFLFLFAGAQNLIFLGPRFRSDFSEHSLTQKSIFRPVSGEGEGNGDTPLRPLFLFFLLFFSFFFSLVSFFFFFSFPAFLSGFNKRCFLRSRCSMEMWCLDNIGRDSWDRVGRPTMEGA